LAARWPSTVGAVHRREPAAAAAAHLHRQREGGGGASLEHRLLAAAPARPPHRPAVTTEDHRSGRRRRVTDQVGQLVANGPCPSLHPPLGNLASRQPPARADARCRSHRSRSPRQWFFNRSIIDRGPPTDLPAAAATSAIARPGPGRWRDGGCPPSPPPAISTSPGVNYHDPTAPRPPTTPGPISRETPWFLPTPGRAQQPDHADWPESSRSRRHISHGCPDTAPATGQVRPTTSPHRSRGYGAVPGRTARAPPQLSGRLSPAPNAHRSASQPNRSDQVGALAHHAARHSQLNGIGRNSGPGGCGPSPGNFQEILGWQDSPKQPDRTRQSGNISRSRSRSSMTRRGRKRRDDKQTARIGP